MGLTVYTWKHSEHGKGFGRPVKSILTGGNVGHAAVELTWPSNQEGDELAKKYQDAKGIVISKRTEIVPEKGPDDRYVPKEQVVYFAYFSWWPGYANGHHINKLSEDRIAEWNNDPEGNLTPESVTKLHGAEGAPESTKTKVKGVLGPKDKEVVKINKIEHPSLKKDISSDPAYQELESAFAKLIAEKQKLDAKSEIYKQELEKALAENRAPDKSLDLTTDEFNASREIIKELARIKRQLELCKEDFAERHISEGTPPDVTVLLPTDKDMPENVPALDTEKMLAEMVKLSESSIEYSMRTFNCSTAAQRVIRSGIGDDLKAKMKADKFDVDNVSKAVIDTPTKVYKLGYKLQKEFIRLPDEPQEKRSAENLDDDMEPSSGNLTAKSTAFKTRMQTALDGDRDDSSENKPPSISTFDA